MCANIKFTLIAFIIFDVDFLVSETPPFLYLVTTDQPPPDEQEISEEGPAIIFVYESMENTVDPEHPHLYLVTNRESQEKLREVNQASHEKDINPENTPHLYLITNSAPDESVTEMNAASYEYEMNPETVPYLRLITNSASHEKLREMNRVSQENGMNLGNTPYLRLITNPEPIESSEEIDLGEIVFQSGEKDEGKLDHLAAFIKQFLLQGGDEDSKK